MNVLPDTRLLFRFLSCAPAATDGRNPRPHSTSGRWMIARPVKWRGRSCRLRRIVSFYRSAVLRKSTGVRRNILREKLTSVPIPKFVSICGALGEMSDVAIGQHCRGIVGGNESCGQTRGIAGLHQPVAAAGHQQGRRRAGQNMEDRLRLGPIGAAENHFEFFVAQRHHSLCRECSA
jgi:hypothetical protein